MGGWDGGDGRWDGGREGDTGVRDEQRWKEQREERGREPVSEGGMEQGIK